MAFQKRLDQEYADIVVGDNTYNVQKSSDDKMQWTAIFIGPEGTPYSNGMYKLIIRFPDEYPMKPMSVQFVNPPYALNVVEEAPNDNDSNLAFGGISHKILSTSWSPAENVATVLNELFTRCFLECGYDTNYDGLQQYPSAQSKVFRHKYELYTYRPREFLFTASKHNEKYGEGDKAQYFILPQQSTEQYFCAVSVIDTVLREQYACNEDIISNVLLFHGKKLNHCGLNNHLFVTPPFEGIEDDEHQQQTVPKPKTRFRSFEEIETDIIDAEKNNKCFQIIVGMIHGCASRRALKVHLRLTVADVKVLWWNIRGVHYWSEEGKGTVLNGRVIFQSKVLPDGMRLSDCGGVNENSQMYIVFRLYGG